MREGRGRSLGDDGLIQFNMCTCSSYARPSLSSLRIWNRSAPRAEALAADLRAQGIRAEATQDLDAAVAEADVISCVTMSRKPLIKGALLKPGAHVDLVGAYLPDMREADDDTMRRGTVYTCCDRGRDEVGKVTSVLATLFLVLSGCNAESLLSYSISQNGTRSSKDTTLHYTVMPDQECPSKYNDLLFTDAQTVHPSAKLCFY